MLKIKTYLRANKFETSPKDLANYMNNEILPGLGFDPPPTIRINTARNYLKSSFGFEFNEVKKGVYKDGHEREDVVKYQQEFLAKMAGENITYLDYFFKSYI